MGQFSLLHTGFLAPCVCCQLPSLYPEMIRKLTSCIWSDDLGKGASLEKSVCRREGGRWQVPVSACLAPALFPQSALSALISACSRLLFGNTKFQANCGTLLFSFSGILWIAILIPSALLLVEIRPSVKVTANAAIAVGRRRLGHKCLLCIFSEKSI